MRFWTQGAPPPPRPTTPMPPKFEHLSHLWNYKLCLKHFVRIQSRTSRQTRLSHLICRRQESAPRRRQILNPSKFRPSCTPETEKHRLLRGFSREDLNQYPAPTSYGSRDPKSLAGLPADTDPSQPVGFNRKRLRVEQNPHRRNNESNGNNGRPEATASSALDPQTLHTE